MTGENGHHPLLDIFTTLFSYLKLGKPQKALEDTEMADEHYRRDMQRIQDLLNSKFLTDEDRDVGTIQRTY